MDTYGKLIRPDTLQFERIVPGPIERVWEYLTDSKKRGLWFASGELEMKKGGVMHLVFNNSQLSDPPDPAPQKYQEFGDGFKSQATVIKCQPPTQLVIHWEDGIVSFELEELEDKVKLTLTHEKLQETKEYRIGTFAGWHTHLDILVDRMNDRSPQGFWKVHMPLEDEYSRLLS